MTILLQKATVSHWLDPTFRLLEVPQAQIDRQQAGVMEPGDWEMIQAFDKQQKEMIIGMQKSMGIIRETLGPVMGTTLERFFQDERYSMRSRIIRAFNSFDDEYTPFALEVAYEIRAKMLSIPKATESRQIHDIIFLLEHYNEELFRVHRQSMKSDMDLKLELQSKISLEHFRELHADFRRHGNCTFAEAKVMCKNYDAPHAEFEDLRSGGDRQAYWTKTFAERERKPAWLEDRDKQEFDEFQRWRRNKDDRSRTRMASFQDRQSPRPGGDYDRTSPRGKANFDRQSSWRGRDQRGRSSERGRSPGWSDRRRDDRSRSRDRDEESGEDRPRSRRSDYGNSPWRGSDRDERSSRSPSNRPSEFSFEETRGRFKPIPSDKTKYQAYMTKAAETFWTEAQLENMESQGSSKPKSLDLGSDAWRKSK